MINIIIYVSIGIVIGYIGYSVFVDGNVNENNEKQVLDEKENKIFDLVSSNKKITNSDVKGLLGVSEATATRYLQKLEDSGKIRQVGETGRSVYYELI